MHTKFDNGKENLWDLVIAADGIHSDTRKLCFGTSNLKKFDILTWRFTTHLDTTHIQPTYYFGKDTLFLIYPISPSQVYCYAHKSGANFKHSKHPKELLKQEFDHYTPMVNKLIDQVRNNEIICGQLQSVSEVTFFKDQVAFIGDASNACSPLLQQGAACAFEDAITLANMLKKYPISDALNAYQRFREPRVSWIVESSDKPLESLLFKKASWLTALLRNKMIKKNGPMNVQGWRELFKTNPIHHFN